MERVVLNRRRVLTGLGVLGMAGVIPSSVAAHAGARTAARRVFGSHRTPSIVQILAHQDDDTLFVNPDLSAALAAGVSTTTVYLTAGEGMGAVDHSRTRLQYAADRQDAARAAYAQLLGVSGSWDRQAVTLPGGQSAELSTPPGIDHVRLLFLNLPEAYDVTAVPDLPGVPHGMALAGLFLGQRSDVPTIVPNAGPITEAYRYTKDSLLAALTGFLHEYQPTVLRTLDPMFAEQHWRGSSDIGGDHPDHIVAARWADVALQRYLTEEPASRIFVVNHVGNGMAALPANLSTTQSTAKAATFKAYSTHDVNERRYAYYYSPHQHRRHHRWTPGSLRALPNGTGVTVFGVVDQQVVQWTCTDVTGSWDGPFALGGTGARALDAVTHADGRIRLFTLQVDALSGVSGIVSSVQDSPGGWFGPWSEPQNPFPTAGAAASAATLRGDALGQPAAVVTPDGAVSLFVRAADATVYLRTLTARGDWLAWTRLGGRFVLDGICPLVSADGLLELYATAMVEPAATAQPAVARLVRWAQPNRGGALAADTLFTAAQTAGAPVAVLDQDGTPRVLYQLPNTAQTAMLTRNPNGTWGPATQLTATGGSGPIVAVSAPAPAGRRLHIAAGTPGAGVGIFQQGTDASFPTTWQDLGGCWPGPPALTADLSGRVVAAGIRLDGRLAVAGQPYPGAGVAYSEFRAVGD